MVDLQKKKDEHQLYKEYMCISSQFVMLTLILLIWLMCHGNLSLRLQCPHLPYKRQKYP
jgi:hypothetical protein